MLLVLRPYNEVDGGLGNYLLHLCHSILYAQARQATVLIPRPMAYSTMNSRAVALDFSAKPSPNHQRPPWWDGVSSIERVPRSYDVNQIEVISGLLHGNPITRQVPFAERVRCMQDYVRPLFSGAAPYRELADGTLAIHIRSGDIFESEPNAKYGQPPFSWYEMLIERSGYDEVVIVAQTKFSIGFENPALTEIRRRWPAIEVISQSPEEDFHTLRHARHVALSIGTFAVAAAMLNTRLESVHIPRYDRVADENFGNSNIFPPGEDLSFTQYDYEIRRYEAMREWHNTPEQRDLMLRHSLADIEISVGKNGAHPARGRWDPAVVTTKRPPPGS